MIGSISSVILTLYQRTKFQTSPNSSSCRQQNNSDSNIEVCVGKIGNIERNGENAGYQHFLLFQHCFQKLFISRSVKSRDSVVMG